MKHSVKTEKYILFLAIFLFFLLNTEKNLTGQTNVDKEIFEVKYKSWVNYRDKLISYKSVLDTNEIFENVYFKEIVNLGPSYVPLLIEKQQEDHLLGYALYKITKFKWHEKREGKRPEAWIWHVEEFPDISEKGGSPDSRVLWLRWWKGGREQAGNRFKLLYNKWKVYKAEGKSSEAKNTQQTMRALGIVVTPYIIEKIKEGDTELIETVYEITGGKLKKTATKSETVDWWQRNKEDWLIPFPNKQPVANAGERQIVEAGDVVKLDASDSNDLDNDRLEFSWRQTAGPTVKLDDPNNAKTKFTAPIVDKQTVLTFELIVNDGSPVKVYPPKCESGKSKPSIVKITIKPK